jgi:hypothetical protein
MHRSVNSRGLVPLGLSLCIAVSSTAASAQVQDNKQVCVDAYETSQRLRLEKKLSAAREQLVVCATASCPTVVSRDCTQWLKEVEAALPSIVVAAQNEQRRDVTAVSVLVDGVTVATHLDGTALAVDPGLHVFHFEMEGAHPVEQSLLVREGEKNRMVAVAFTPREPVRDENAEAANRVAAATVNRSHNPPAATYVLGGIALAGLGGFVGFGLSGLSDESRLKSSCSNTCPQSQVDQLHHKYLAADISLGIGVAALTGAVLVWLGHRTPAGDPVVSIGARWVGDAASATVNGTF